MVAAAARLYAKQAKAGKPAAAAASARAATGPKPDDAYAPPEFRMRRVPQGSAVDAVAQMTPGQVRHNLMWKQWRDASKEVHGAACISTRLVVRPPSA